MIMDPELKTIRNPARSLLRILLGMRQVYASIAAFILFVVLLVVSIIYTLKI
jgi:hypothetical protein